MTAPSSNKMSFFREYFLLRLSAQKGSLLLCCVFNVMTLPMFSYKMFDNADCLYRGLGGVYYRSDFYDLIDFFALFCGIGLLIMSIAGAAVSFVSYNRKPYTDAIGALPLTHRERFWGDFLSGYTANVAPVIPAGIVSVIISFGMQDRYNKIDAASGIEPMSSSGVMFFVGIALSMLTALTFCYIVSTIAAVCCGRLMHAEILSVISVLAPTFAVFGTVCCFANAVTGLYSYDLLYLAIDILRYFSPIGGLLDIKGGINYMNGIDLSEQPLSGMFYNDFAVFDPLYIAFAVISAAALTALAYYLSKSRRQERVGSVLVHKAFFRVLSVIAAWAAVTVVLAVCAVLINFVAAALIAAAAGAVVFPIMEVIRKPRARELPKTLLCWAGTVAVCVGLYILFDKTAAFGQRYFNISAGKVDNILVEIDYSDYSGKRLIGEYTITDKADIEKLTDAHNAALKDIYGDLTSGGGFSLEYTLTDGSTKRRGYSGKRYGVERLIGNLYGLDSFPEMQSELILRLSDGVPDCKALLEGVYGTMTVPEDRTKEFLELYAEDIREKFSPDAVETGSVILNVENGSHFPAYYPIAEDYTRTTEYLTALYNETDHSTDHTLVLRIVCSDPSDDREYSITLNIFRKDLESESVKELISLLKRRGDHKPDDSSDKFEITTTDAAAYYVPEDAEERVLGLILKLAEEAAE